MASAIWKLVYKIINRDVHVGKHQAIWELPGQYVAKVPASSSGPIQVCFWFIWIGLRMGKSQHGASDN